MNAGHNAPIIFGHGVIKLLEATGLPLGLFNDAEYEARTTQLDQGNSLLLFTHGLADAIASDDPEGHLRATLGDDNEKTMSRPQSLVDSKLNRDDVHDCISGPAPTLSCRTDQIVFRTSIRVRIHPSLFMWKAPNEKTKANLD